MKTPSPKTSRQSLQTSAGRLTLGRRPLSHTGASSLPCRDSTVVPGLDAGGRRSLRTSGEDDGQQPGWAGDVVRIRCGHDHVVCRPCAAKKLREALKEKKVPCCPRSVECKNQFLEDEVIEEILEGDGEVRRPTALRSAPLKAFTPNGAQSLLNLFESVGCSLWRIPPAWF